MFPSNKSGPLLFTLQNTPHLHILRSHPWAIHHSFPFLTGERLVQVYLPYDDLGNLRVIVLDQDLVIFP